MLVASGWTLGFLESICFAIAIGISCDFVIHFAHAYGSLDGDENRSERTKYSLIRMGPSILAAAFTTACSATVMIFTTIS
jgi:predicted RND superfamily exporter protein|mmetsp:Transcript_26915/g.48721  ORF Transcript_26915/g.48721 Transcript_26915/m.48721 type:complete len:80 (-) Transcript_26915:412-651(-)